jgi:hypothetical protein
MQTSAAEHREDPGTSSMKAATRDAPGPSWPSIYWFVTNKAGLFSPTSYPSWHLTG